MSEAAERLAEWLRHPQSEARAHSQLIGCCYESTPVSYGDLRAVLAEIAELRAEWAERNGVAEERLNNLSRALARLDAVRRLCDAQGEDSYVMVRALRAVLDSPPSVPAEQGEVSVDRWAEAINEHVGHCGNLDCNCDLDDNHIADRIIECFRDAGWQVVERPSPPSGPEVPE